MLGNRVLRRIFRPNEELNDLTSSPNFIWVMKSRRMKWVGHVAHMEERRGAYRVLVGKPEEKGPLGRPRCRCEHNIKMDLQEVGWGAWTGLIWLRVGKLTFRFHKIGKIS